MSTPLARRDEHATPAPEDGVRHPVTWDSPAHRNSDHPAFGHLERRSPPRLVRDRISRPGLVRPSFGANDSLPGTWNDSDGDASMLGLRTNGHAGARLLQFGRTGVDSSEGRTLPARPKFPAMDLHNHSRELPPRLSVGGARAGTIAEETSASVLRDEQQANNSGLLGYTPNLSFGESPARRTALATATTTPRDQDSRKTPTRQRTDRQGSVKRSHSPNQVDQAPEADPALVVTRLRTWMHDAMRHHLYETAIFWGDKLLSIEITEEAYNDAYFLALAYFLSHQYHKAIALLSTPLLSDKPAHSSTMEGAYEETAGEESDALAVALAVSRETGLIFGKQKSSHRPHIGKRKERSFTVSGTGTGSEDEALSEAEERSESSGRGRHPLGDPGASDPGDDDWLEDVDLCVKQVKAQAQLATDGPCLLTFSQACRYLAAQCYARIGRYHDALNLLGRNSNAWKGSDNDYHKVPASDGGIKLVSSACHLRGLIYLRLDELDKARENFMKALSLDVKNYESFAALLDGSLLAADALWDFIQHLDFKAQSCGRRAGAAADELDIVKHLYTLRLPQQSIDQSRQCGIARRRLAMEFGVGLSNPEVLLGLAEGLYDHLRYEDASMITSRIMEICTDHPGALPIHIGCMYHIERLKPSLFVLAHHLSEADPDNACAWYAVGAWYASTGRWLESRRYFSKSSLLDPRFAPAWIAFAHSFAMQGESDQAIIAYSTAARKFQQSHLPKVFIGMEHVHQGNFHLASLFFKAADSLLHEDPLCLNESGVVAFHRREFGHAIKLFSKAIERARVTNGSIAAWSSCLLNLAHAHRHIGDLGKAASTYAEVLDLDPNDTTAHLGLALVELQSGNLLAAVEHAHATLSIDPRDSAAATLLGTSLERLALQYPFAHE